MPRDKKQRIATEAGPAGWANPFAALDLGPLPPVPGQASPATPPPTAKLSRLLLRRSTAHRGGKTVILLEGFPAAWTETRLRELLRELKAALGCGGTLEGRLVEIQGEQADRLQPLLEARGFAVKRGW